MNVRNVLASLFAGKGTFNKELLTAIVAMGLSAAHSVQAAPGYTYVLLWEGPNNQNSAGAEAYCPGAAINNRGDVVFRTAQTLSGVTVRERIRVYVSWGGQTPELVHETFTNNNDPTPSGRQCNEIDGGLGINDNGIVAIPSRWVEVNQNGDITAFNDTGYVLVQPGVGIIRELRNLQSSSGRLNNNLQMAGVVNGGLVVTDGLNRQASSAPFGANFQGLANINADGLTSVGAIFAGQNPTTTLFSAIPPANPSFIFLGTYSGQNPLTTFGFTDFFSPGINDLGWNSFSTNFSGPSQTPNNPNPRVLLVSPAGQIFPVAEANGSDFSNFFQTRGAASAGTSLNNFNRVSFVAQLDGDDTAGTAGNIYVGDASGDPPHVAIDNDVDFGDGRTFNGFGLFANDVADHGLNSMNDLGEIVASNLVNVTDSTGSQNRQILLLARPAPGMEPGNPIIPDLADALPGGGWQVRLSCQPPPPVLPMTFCTVAGGGSTTRGYFDPPIAVGYDYKLDAASPTAFTSLLVPVPLAGGDANFTVEFNGHSADVTAGTVFEFATYTPDPVKQFRISGIDEGEVLNPDDPAAFVVGLTFTGNDAPEISFTMIPVAIDTTDTDGDGVGDSFDNCPDAANPGQEDQDADGVGNACDTLADADTDGVPDANDLCPDTAPGAIVDINGCSAAQLDSDYDGVKDNTDNCPTVANPNQLNFDNDVLGDACDPDMDNDGVFNGPDQCDATPVADRGKVDATGCVPAARVCDVDLDRDIDARDITLILKALGKKATGSNDPRDSNFNRRIDLRDAAICTGRCDRAFCAIR